MNLGDLLKEPEHACSLLQPALRAQIEAAGMAPERFARVAVADFERRASAEDWVNLMSILSRVDDPGAACLDAMVRWRLGAILQARRAPDRSES